LSKGCIAENDDFDFFIIADANKLWISYILLHAFKKLTFLLGMQHRFCMNYFIDTTALKLERQHIYTAIELESMIPLYGTGAYNQLMRVNNWTKNYLPNNYVKFDPINAIDNKTGIFKKLLESIFNTLGAEKINRSWMNKIEARRRKKIEANVLPSSNRMVFNTTLHVSTNHRADREKHILKKLSDVGYK
jgi:hypothetical protein